MRRQHRIKHSFPKIALFCAALVLSFTAFEHQAQGQGLPSVFDKAITLQKLVQPKKRSRTPARAKRRVTKPSRRRAPARGSSSNRGVGKRLAPALGKLIIELPQPTPPDTRGPRPKPPRLTDRTPPRPPPRPNRPIPQDGPGARLPPPCGLSIPSSRPCPASKQLSGNRVLPEIALPKRHPGRGGRYLDDLPRFEERTPSPILSDSPDAVPRQVVVLIGRDQPVSLEDDLATDYSLERLESETIEVLEARAQVYGIGDNRPEQAVIAALAGDPRIMLAQRNLIYRRQSAGNKAAQAAQYGLEKIGAGAAHELSTGHGVRIAVIDTGIDEKHPDLAGAVVEVFDAVNDGDAEPDHHGTAIAGIISGRGLVAGVAPGAELLSVRAFYADSDRRQPVTSSFILLKAVNWAIKADADVANLSFSGPRDAAVGRVVTAAAERGVILVAAAGNGGPEADPAYPAAYPDVIAVTAHDRGDERYAHANRGAYIALAAPGVDILVPATEGTHAFMSGTSMAAAHVTGIVALLLERVQHLNHQKALGILTATAEDLGVAGRDEDFGAGRAHALAALEEALARAPARVSRN